MSESADYFIFSFCINPAYDEQQNPFYLLKIRSDDYWELNISLNDEELNSVPNIINSSWNERSSLKIGKCLGSPTFWSYENENLSILVGKDDETWEFGVNIKGKFVKYLLEEIENAKKRYVKKNGKWLY